MTPSNTRIVDLYQSPGPFRRIRALRERRYVFRSIRSPLCEYMINFIHKLKHLPEKYNDEQRTENFTILQVVINRDTLETLLCIAYVFEVSTSEHGAQHHIYRLVKD
ncbi:hypothetical protein cypCar_00026298 [Cyprinus carpio]|nr:hypothetical protein cypCar_00026298 [Cyprinus carpio]